MIEKARRAESLERFERYTALPLLFLALVMIPVILAPMVFDLDASVDSTLTAVDWIIWGVFAADLSIRTYLAEGRLRYLRRHWFDVLIVVLPFLRPLRLAQTARLLPVLRLARVLPVAVRVGFATHRILQRRGTQYVLLASLAAIGGTAFLVLLFERGHEGNIQDLGTAIWWAVTTVTTVGYGDAVPVTMAGRGLAIFLMVIGISLFSWLTANIAAFFVEGDLEQKQTVSLEDVMAKLESVEEQLRALSTAQRDDVTSSRR